MDITRPVIYNGLTLTDAATAAAGSRIDGISIESADFSGVPAIGYTEKRALGDGNDASDVFLGPRQVSLQGVVYGSTRAKLYDRLRSLRAAFVATVAYALDEEEKGYLPLYFSELTEDAAFDGFIINEYIRARALQGVQFAIIKDRVGGRPELGGSLPWSIVLQAKDPRIYVSPAETYPLDDLSAGISDTISNRGFYPSPLGVHFVVPVATTGSIVVRVGGAILSFDIESSAAVTTYLYNSGIKVLEVRNEDTGITTLRMDLLNQATEATHAEVPAGDTALVIDAVAITLSSGSYLYWQESFA